MLRHIKNSCDISLCEDGRLENRSLGQIKLLCIERAWYKRVRIRSGAVNKVERLVRFGNDSRIMVSPCQITGDYNTPMHADHDAENLNYLKQLTCCSVYSSTKGVQKLF